MPSRVSAICVACGGTFQQRTDRRPTHCQTCNIERHVAELRDIGRREGPGWERVIRVNLERWAGEAVKLGIHVTITEPDGPAG